MPVSRIEKITAGVVVQWAEQGSDGYYQCHPFGSNVESEKFSSLDEAANFLRKNLKSGVRMNPGWAKISKNIYIDGTPR